MPIKSRIDMLTTGIRTPVGIKIYGADLDEIEQHRHADRSACCRRCRARAASSPSAPAAATSWISTGSATQLARYGLSVDDAQAVVMNAIGGENVTTTVEGRERYPVNVRYMRDFRSDLGRAGPRAGARRWTARRRSRWRSSPTSKLATGPAMLRDENGMLTGYVYVDVAGRDVGGYVDEAKRVVREKVQLPPGYSLAWSGQYEAMERVASG